MPKTNAELLRQARLRPRSTGRPPDRAAVARMVLRAIAPHVDTPPPEETEP